MAIPAVGIAGLPISGPTGLPAICGGKCTSEVDQNPLWDRGLFDINVTPGPNTGWTAAPGGDVIGSIIRIYGSGELPWRYGGRPAFPASFSVSLRFPIMPNGGFSKIGIWCALPWQAYMWTSISSTEYQLATHVDGIAFNIQNVQQTPQDNDIMKITADELTITSEGVDGNGKYISNGDWRITYFVNDIQIGAPYVMVDARAACGLFHGSKQETADDFSNLDYLYESNY